MTTKYLTHADFKDVAKIFENDLTALQLALNSPQILCKRTTCLGMVMLDMAKLWCDNHGIYVCNELEDDLLAYLDEWVDPELVLEPLRKIHAVTLDVDNYCVWYGNVRK